MRVNCNVHTLNHSLQELCYQYWPEPESREGKKYGSYVATTLDCFKQEGYIERTIGITHIQVNIQWNLSNQDSLKSGQPLYKGRFFLPKCHFCVVYYP